ncbi:fibronectin type III domain-containing protein [Paenibacillus sp. GCM10023250]|uniref:fibronectin type III domain-containing protein n=1 Tax=Paenibacillus sp. GCM10023250 TaxID=3252648 RepID=UPI00361A77E3
MNRRSMLWMCGLLLLTLLLPFRATASESDFAAAQEDIQITLKQLTTDHAATKLQIAAAVTSLYELKSVTASTSGREVPLTRACPSCDWKGELPLSGLAKGKHTLIITAVDIYDSTRTGTGAFTYDEPPVITRMEPANGAIIRDTSLHVIAEAEDDLAKPSFLVQIGLSPRYPDFIESDGGTGKFDRVFDVTKFNGRSLSIEYIISDGQQSPGGDDNHRINLFRTVYVETSPELVEMERESGSVLDADESRLLLAGSGELIIKNRSDGTETKLPNDGYANHGSWFRLTPAGAAFLVDEGQDGYTRMMLHTWNGEKLTSTDVPPELTWQFSGNYALGGDSWWIDTKTGTARTIPKENDNELAVALEPGGTLLLDSDLSGQKSGRIFRYDPVTGSLTIAFEYPGAPSRPVTDGQAVLFTVNDGSSLMKYQDGTVTEVDRGTTAGRISDYTVHEGWIAFQKPSASNVRQVYLRSPEGKVTQATSFNKASSIHSLDSSGTLVIENDSKLYQYRQGMDKPTLIASSQGKLKSINGQLVYLLSDTLFGVKSPSPSDTEAPAWPQGDVLTYSDVTASSVQLHWQPAADNTGVANYLLYQNNQLLTTLSGSANRYEVKGLSPKSSYLFSLAAVDAAGNVSSKQNVTVATAADNPAPTPETLLNRFDGTILDFDQHRIVWKAAGDPVLWLYNRTDRTQVKVYDAAGTDYTIGKAMLSADGVVYTLSLDGSPMTYYWKNGAVLQHWEGETQYDTRGIPDGAVVYKLNGTTYLYSTLEGKQLYSFSGPGELYYREHVYSGPGALQYRYGAWYRVDGGTLYSIRI